MTTRRDAMRTIGAGIVALAAGCDGEKDPEPGACTLYPEQTEGPYHLDQQLLRADITEGKPGAPLSLRVRARDSNCEPLAGALVDVWQCDAAGVYSGYPGQLGGLDTTGQTFLRGVQPCDADGVATFGTIYPGWYPGRTTHIHFKVIQGASEATSQLYFPEDVTSSIYATGEYAARGQKDTTNAADGIAGEVALLAVTSDGAGGWIAAIDVTVAL